MSSQSQKSLYSKYPNQTHNQPTEDPQGIQAMKKSVDSLYKKLNTPNHETEQTNQPTPTDLQYPNQQTISSIHHPSNHLHKQNLTSKLNHCVYFSKQSSLSQFEYKNLAQKIQKPSTPTFHAQSSLNFLKNRKQQIIMNQAMGLTYDNLQILRKSLSKSRSDKNSNKSLLQRQTSQHKDHQINFSTQKQKTILKSNDLKPNHKFQKVRSVSQLTKIESILDGNDQTSNKRSFLQRSRIKNQSVYIGSKSETNSLRSSRALSNESKNSKSSTSRQIRAVLINSIVSKIDESRFFKDIEFTKQKKKRKQTNKKQNLLEKRLQSLQKILFEIQKNDHIKTTNCSDPLQFTKKQGLNNAFMNKLKSQIDDLTQQLQDLQKWTVNQSLNKQMQQKQLKGPVKKSQVDQKCFQFNKRIQGKKIENRVNKHIFPISGSLSQVETQKPIQGWQKSHTKITFNYKNTQNQPPIQKFVQIDKNSCRIGYSTQNKLKYQFTQSRLPYNDSFNSAARLPSYNLLSDQNRTHLNNFQNIQYTTHSLTNQFNSRSHNLHIKNSQMPKQLLIVPQISYHQNKTIQLKNKHAIQAKRHSPVKVNQFNFMANNNFKTNFH